MVELSLKSVTHLHVDVAAANDAAARRLGGLVSCVAQSRLSKSSTALVSFSRIAAPSKHKRESRFAHWGGKRASESCALGPR